MASRSGADGGCEWGQKQSEPDARAPDVPGRKIPDQALWLERRETGISGGLPCADQLSIRGEANATQQVMEAWIDASASILRSPGRLKTPRTPSIPICSMGLMWR